MHEVFEHTADLGLRVRTQELPQLFVEAGQGLLAILIANPDAVRPVEERRYSIAGQAYDYLLFDWLTELLYTFDTERLLLCRFQVTLDDNGLKGVCLGEFVDASRHEMDHEVKAITYHGLKVESTSQGWLAEVIVDI